MAIKLFLNSDNIKVILTFTSLKIAQKKRHTNHDDLKVDISRITQKGLLLAKKVSSINQTQKAWLCFAWTGFSCLDHVDNLEVFAYQIWYSSGGLLFYYYLHMLQMQNVCGFEASLILSEKCFSNVICFAGHQ